MEIYQIRTFITVAQQGHLTQAAELLHLSQPAVTAQIKALEEEFGMALFERSSGGVRLTRAGEELLPRAHTVLESARDLLNHSRSLRQEVKGKAVIGTITTPEMTLIGPWVSALTEKYPLIDINLQHGVTGQVLNRVRKKELDAGFYIGKNPYVNVSSVALTELSFCVAAPYHWRERVENKSYRELGKLPWLGISQTSSIYKLTMELWRKMNISPKKITEVDHIPSICSVIESGVGLALLRKDEAEILAAQKRIFILPELENTAQLQFIFPTEREGEPILEVLRNELTLIWEKHKAKQTK